MNRIGGNTKSKNRGGIAFVTVQNPLRPKIDCKANQESKTSIVSVRFKYLKFVCKVFRRF